MVYTRLKCRVCQAQLDRVSSLFRNVPILTSIEMSLFLADAISCPASTISPYQRQLLLTLRAARSARRGRRAKPARSPGLVPGERGFVAVGKWETCFWFSTFPSACFRRSCGNVGISRCLRDFQGTVGRGEILPLDFHSFHRSAISTARFFTVRSSFSAGFVDSLFARGGWPAAVSAAAGAASA
jgi:hypothetical protein